MDKYIFREYSPDYPNFFKQEKRRLDDVFDGAAEIQHVGSTAIPGLGGKGIVDIVIGVPDVLFEKAKGMLEQAGYEYREAASCDDRLFFRRKYGYSKEKRLVHIHLLRHGKQTWLKMIGLRDYLLKNQEVVQQYADIKKKATAIAKGDGETYRKHKEKFIKQVLTVQKYSND